MSRYDCGCYNRQMGYFRPCLLTSILTAAKMANALQPDGFGYVFNVSHGLYACFPVEFLNLSCSMHGVMER